MCAANSTFLLQKIVSRCGGKILIIDTGGCLYISESQSVAYLRAGIAGMSHAYGGALSALSVEYTLIPIGEEEDASAEEPQWLEREIVKALYEDREQVLAVDERRVTGHFKH